MESVRYHRSRRAGSLDLHTINREIAFLYAVESIAAIDSFMIHTCRYSTEARTTKGWSYGRKCHVAMDVDSPILLEWIVTEGNLHDLKVSHDLIDTVRNFSYILADSAYDTSGIYDYIFENTHCIPVIDTNKRRGIRPERLTVNRMIGIDLRREYS